MKKIALPILASGLILSGCSTTDELLEKISPSSTKAVTIEDRNELASQASNNSTSGAIASRDQSSFESSAYQGKVSAQSNAEKIAVANLKSSGVKFTLHFSYDGYEIDEVASKEIVKHANFMLKNPKLNLRLEGHADERGTREYNLALGENRALSVKEVLGLYDLNSRVEVISFGEERPVSMLHEEQGWQKNRRVEFIYY